MIHVGKFGSVYGAAFSYTLCFIYDCASLKCSYVPVPSLNPFIGSPNYTLVNLPKILSQQLSLSLNGLASCLLGYRV